MLFKKLFSTIFFPFFSWAWEPLRFSFKDLTAWSNLLTKSHELFKELQWDVCKIPRRHSSFDLSATMLKIIQKDFYVSV